MPFRFYAHLSWTTWARLPLIDEAVANFLGPFLLAEAKRHGVRARSGAEARPTETLQTAEPFRARVVAEPAL